MYTKKETDSAWEEVKNGVLKIEEVDECRKAWDTYKHPDFLFPSCDFLLAWKIQQEKICDLKDGICESVRLMTIEQKSESAKTAKAPMAQGNDMSKHTPGPWKSTGQSVSSEQGAGISIAWCSNGSCWCKDNGTQHVTKESAESNARLIAEAGTVATETGMTPRQLAEVNRELMEALESIAEYWNQDRNDQAMHNACWYAIETANAAIAKGETK